MASKHAHVMIATVAEEMSHTRFWEDLISLKSYDLATKGHLSHNAWRCKSSSNNIATARNIAVVEFLKTPCEWLLFIDTDQTFPPNILERLIDSADPIERPIVSALIMAKREADDIAPACVGLCDDGMLRRPTAIPPFRHWPCVPGTGCVLIHRTVFEGVAKATVPGTDKTYSDTAFPWFEFSSWHRPDGVVDVMGEDYTFMLRANANGFASCVDTTIEAGHLKTHELTSLDFYLAHPNGMPSRNFVVVPFKDKWPMTRALLEQLIDQGGYDRVFLLNNGSSLETTRLASLFVRTLDDVEMIDAKGLGIHEMWNIGIDESLALAPLSSITFLNNDLALGPEFLETLSAALRKEQALVAVCPNYDNRPSNGEDLAQLYGICANRYDGTGGLSGFAFMVKSEWFASGWRFPEGAMWWYGDNYLTMSIDKARGAYAMVHACSVEHLNGGGQTADGWVNYADTEQGQADLAEFIRVCRDDLSIDVAVKQAS